MNKFLFFLFLSNLSFLHGQDCSEDKGWTNFIENNNKDSVYKATLDLFECTCLPLEIFSMYQVRNLKMIALNLKSLSPQIGNLINLQELTISKSKIDSIPATIGQLKNLKYLAVAAGILTYVPPEIGLLTKLEVLYLNQNNLEHLPNEISNLTNLKELHIKLNKFSEKEKTHIQNLLPNCEIKF